MDPQMLKELALGVIPPGVWGVVAFALAWRTERDSASPSAASRGEPAWRRASVPLIFGVGFLLGCWLIYGTPRRPAQSQDWIPWLGVITGAGATLVSLAPARLIWPIRGVTIATVGWLAARPFAHAWAPATLAAHVGGYAGVTLATVFFADRFASKRPGPATALVLAALVGGAAQLLVLAFHSLKLGQAAGVGAAVLGGALVVSLWRPRAPLGPGGVDVPITLAMTMVFLGLLSTDTDLAPLHGVLVGTGALFAWTARRLMPERWGAARRGAVEVVAGITPIGAGIALALARHAPTDY